MLSKGNAIEDAGEETGVLREDREEIACASLPGVLQELADVPNVCSRLFRNIKENMRECLSSCLAKLFWVRACVLCVVHPACVHRDHNELDRSELVDDVCVRMFVSTNPIRHNSDRLLTIHPILT